MKRRLAKIEKQLFMNRKSLPVIVMRHRDKEKKQFYYIILGGKGFIPDPNRENKRFWSLEQVEEYLEEQGIKRGYEFFPLVIYFTTPEDHIDSWYSFSLYDEEEITRLINENFEYWKDEYDWEEIEEIREKIRRKYREMEK